MLPTVNLPLTFDQLDDLATYLEGTADHLPEAMAPYRGKAPPELRRVAATVGFIRGWLESHQAARDAPPPRRRRPRPAKPLGGVQGAE